MIDPIAYLAKAYFHQDFDLEASTPTLVLEAFKEAESPENVAELRASFEGIISAGKSEEEIASLLLEEAQASYDPRGDGISLSDWFRHALEVLT